MRITYRAIVAMAALCLGGSAVAQTKDQFDLICSGTITHMDGTTKPWSEHISLDLQARLYAYEGAQVPQRIARIEPSQVVLEDDTIGEDIETLLYVSRVDASLYRRASSMSLNMVDVGKATCQVAPFTQLPKTMF